MIRKTELNSKLSPYNVGLKLTWTIPPLLIKNLREVIGRYIPGEAGLIGDIKGVEALKETICH